MVIDGSSENLGLRAAFLGRSDGHGSSRLVVFGRCLNFRRFDMPLQLRREGDFHRENRLAKTETKKGVEQIRGAGREDAGLHRQYGEPVARQPVLDGMTIGAGSCRDNHFKVSCAHLRPVEHLLRFRQPLVDAVSSSTLASEASFYFNDQSARSKRESGFFACPTNTVRRSSS